LIIEPDPTPEEAAAIKAALEALRAEEPEDRDPLNRSRWRLAGLLGHTVPARMKLEGDLWSYRAGRG
jgi:hypothetical protein